MARRRRSTSFSNMSFLDIMSCGFGAVVLVFLITKHSMSVHADEVNEVLLGEVDRIEVDVQVGELDLVQLREALAEAEARVADAEARAAQVTESISAEQVDLARLKEVAAAREESIEQLKSEVESLEAQAEAIDGGGFGTDASGSAARSVRGDGQRQYLTGLRVGGDRVLILFDRSASMLDETIVNIIRRRNMDPERQRAAPKWQQAVGALEWLTARLPLDGRFQLYTFSERVEAVVEGSDGRWLDVTGPDLDAAVSTATGQLPSGGTALAPAFDVIGRLAPPPDNIFLITDGLPTRDAREPRRGTVTGRQRERLFADALDSLPPGIPVNVVLLHLEGDPMAAVNYWRLAVASGGAFLAPSKDWP